MEKNKTQKAEGQKLSYEDLNRAASDLYQQNQKLIAQIKQMQTALEERDFNYTSFFISMLFKVVEHPEAYTDNFLKWAIECIESSLTSFGNMLMTQKEEKPEEKEKKDEAE